MRDHPPETAPVSGGVQVTNTVMPRKTTPKSKLTDQDKRLIQFAKSTLWIMEDHKEWSSDTMDDIHTEANRFGFADQDDDGCFKANLS